MVDVQVSELPTTTDRAVVIEAVLFNPGLSLSLLPRGVDLDPRSSLWQGPSKICCDTR
jgi:hypothetical protein